MHLKPLNPPKAHILLLEDDPFLRAGLAGLLGEAGYTLVQGLDGVRGAGRIDLVLVGMGEVPRAALQGLDRSPPVILLPDLVSWSGLDFLDIANAFGAVAVLPRPFSRAALLSLVAQTLSTRAAADRAEIPSLAERLNSIDNPNFA